MLYSTGQTPRVTARGAKATPTPLHFDGWAGARRADIVQGCLQVPLQRLSRQRLLVTVPDADGLKALLRSYGTYRVPRLKKGWVDGGYRGQALQAWVAQLKRTHKIALEVVKKQATGFTILKRRWVVERTFAWLLNYRIHAKDYEVLPCNREAFIYIAMIHLILKRLA